MNEETDVVFFINSAMNVTGRSLFTNEERWIQTQETILSIDKYVPNNIKYIIDGSFLPIEEYKTDWLQEHNVRILSTGQIDGIREISQHIAQYGIGNSIAETQSMMHFVHWYKKAIKNITKAKRICKLSGRYKINENFKWDDPAYEGKYVFVKHHESNSPRKEELDLKGLFVVRCWHMDYALLDNYVEVITKIAIDCASLGIDAENSYYKNIPKDLLYEVEKIGVEGYVSPVGVYENE
jgi:hypothetical protein